jgi:expansin (peptidoglycan-binding protein)
MIARNAFWLAASLAASGCMTAPHEARMAYLKVVAEPASTTVYISDRFVGSAHLLQKQPKALPTGVKYLTFKAPGYFPHDLRVTLPKGETTVKIKLRQIPP